MVKNVFKLPVDDKGLGPDVARSMEDWDSFKEYHKKHNPIRYFLHHEFEPMFVWPITHRVKRVTDWIKYRTYKRYHIVDTGLEPGYYDTDTKMLHACFNMLKEFVEVEKAYHWNWMGANDLNLKGKDAGIAHLAWEMTIPENESRDQAKNAREIYELYEWWTIERPNRQDPWDLVDDTKREELNKDSRIDSREKYNELYGEHDKLLKQHEDEDDEMFIRLIKIRKALWT